MKNRIFFAFLVSLNLIACKSVYEKQGDTHLADNDGLSALQRYKMVKAGKGSKDFPKSLAKAYILGMKQTADSVGDPEVILTYRERIIELLTKKVDSPELEKLYVQGSVRIAEKLAVVPDPRFRDICRSLAKDAEKFGASDVILGRMARVVEEVNRLEAAAIKAAEEKAAKAGRVPLP